MGYHRDRRATPHGAKISPPLCGCPWKTAERRRLLARSFSYAAVLRSSSAVFHGQSRSLLQLRAGPDPTLDLVVGMDHRADGLARCFARKNQDFGGRSRVGGISAPQIHCACLPGHGVRHPFIVPVADRGRSPQFAGPAPRLDG